MLVEHRYWIISAREAIREWESMRMTCKRRTAKAATQISLPFETNSRHTFLPDLMHDETYPPQRLCILSLGGLYGALQI